MRNLIWESTEIGKLRVMFIDDEIAKVRELIHDITPWSAEIISFEPFYDIDETFREVLSQAPDIIFMDHWLVNWVPVKADWDKVIHELVKRWYKWKFITNTGWDANKNFSSVRGLRNEAWHRVIIENANKNAKIIGSLIQEYSQSISHILNLNKVELITRRALKEKLLSSSANINDLTEEEKNYILDSFWGDDIEKKYSLMLLLYPEEYIVDHMKTASVEQEKAMIEAIKRLAWYWVFSPDSILLTLISGKKQEETIEEAVYVPRKNLIKIALENWYDSLVQEEKEELSDEIRKTEYWLTSYSKIKNEAVYKEVLSRFKTAADYEKKAILNEMINGDYNAYARLETEAFDWIDLNSIDSSLAIMIMLKNPLSEHKKKFTLLWHYSRFDMQSATLCLIAYWEWAELPDYLIEDIWENREKILDFDRFECVEPKAIFALMSFGQFSAEYDESQKNMIISRILDKWRRKWKLSYFRDFSALTKNDYKFDLSLKNIEEFWDYDMDEIFEEILNKKLSLDKNCFLKFIKKQLAKWAYENLRKLLEIYPELKIWAINWEEASTYIKPYSPKSMIELIFELLGKKVLGLENSAKEHILNNYPWVSVQIALEKLGLKEVARYLWTSEGELNEIASRHFLENFNFFMLSKLRKSEWKQDEFKKLFLLSELY